MRTARTFLGQLIVSTLCSTSTITIGLLAADMVELTPSSINLFRFMMVVPAIFCLVRCVLLLRRSWGLFTCGTIAIVSILFLTQGLGHTENSIFFALAASMGAWAFIGWVITVRSSHY